MAGIRPSDKSTILKTAVIVPTYNEAENVAPLIEHLLGLEPELHIIVVDDNSPDGTGEVADEWAKRSPRVHVIHRPQKLGLGTAYAAGFAAALDMGCDFILTMDADFSHNPRYIPALLELAQNNDLAIGSRYVSGGGVRLWGWHRRLLSRGANLIARTLLRLRAHDCTAGFRCYRAQVLHAVDPTSIRSDGYSYLIEMLWRVQNAGFRIAETPIVFTDRRKGTSKISQSEILKAGWTVLQLLFRHPPTPKPALKIE